MIDVVSKINDDLLPMEDDYDMMEEDLIKGCPKKNVTRSNLKSVISQEPDIL